MNLLECQAKALFAKKDIPIPRGRVVQNRQELISALDVLKLPLFLKAQVLTGGRGKMGGVRRVQNADEALRAFEEISSMVIVNDQTGPKGQRVQFVLIEEAEDIVSEIYMALTIDRAAGYLVAIVSGSGGMEIEKTTREHPETMLQIPIDITRGITADCSRQVYNFLQNKHIERYNFDNFLSALYTTFIDNDATLVEINPAGITKKNKIIALDAKITLDDNARGRHPEWAEYESQQLFDPREREAALFGLNYVKLDGGTIGCMVNGAGLAMATMDALKLHGGLPANFLDVGGGVTVEVVTAAFRIVKSDPDVRVVLVNVFGGIVRCDIIAEGLVAACTSIGDTVPLVVRLEGTSAERGRAILKQSGVRLTLAHDLRDAVHQSVARSKE